MERKGRRLNELRDVKIELNVQKFPHGSCYFSMGDTKVLCSAFVEEGVPPFLKGTGQGWITAEYSMLPGSTQTRKTRETSGRLQGRTHEIQRFIGRSLRAALDLQKLGERTIWVDCDVIQADGGTRTAGINGGFIAVYLTLKKMKEAELIEDIPLISPVGAVSVGLVDGEPLLDLSYAEDIVAEVDMNVVMNAKGQFVEIQGTAERRPFNEKDLQNLLSIARAGIGEILRKICEVLDLNIEIAI